MGSCPLCLSTCLNDYHCDKTRVYQQCSVCLLVSVPKVFHLSVQAEKQEYDKHQNSSTDKGYRQFLARTTTPLFSELIQRAKSHETMSGLDFGCGPGPAISEMAKEVNLQVSNYDIYYRNDKKMLEQCYDFITMTEVIEHVAQPASLLAQLDQLIKVGGIIAIMTKRVSSQQAFQSWHYKNDLTHINFYSEQTFQWIAQKTGWHLKIIDKDVVFFYKNTV